MRICPDTGIIEGVQQIPSSNFNARPSNTTPEVLIVHSISLPPGSYGGMEVVDLFCNRLNCDAHPFFDSLRDLQVSTHLLIRLNGDCIQFVSLNERAWHAGASQCLGRDNVNDFSIGVELEGSDYDSFEEVQYDRLNELIDLLLVAYPNFTRQKIFGHAEISPDRKTDPGPYFEWSRIR